jgi:Transposase DDE domain group 1
VNGTPKWMRGLAAEVAGGGVVSHVGSAALRMLAHKTGLTGALSGAASRPDVVHDRGQVLTDVAVMIADGGTVISDIDTLGDQQELFGPVASAPTAWRALDEVGADAEGRIARARAKTRERVWKMIEAQHGRIPAAKTGYGDLGATVVIRLDATIQVAHSDKEKAAGTFKGTYGHHPLTSWCDNTQESLAVKLRPGNAGSNTAPDHIEVLNAAIAQIPPAHRRNLPITCDGAGSTLDLVRHISALNDRPGHQAHHSVGFDLDERGRAAIEKVPERVWEHVLDADGDPRDLEEAGAAELTGLMRGSAGGDRLSNWPKAMRIICRREKASSGAQLSLFEHDNGWRYQLIATNTPTGGAQRLEARHRPHARVEDRIRTGKDTGLGHLPSQKFAVNQAWCAAAAIGIDLLAWLRLLLLDGDLARAEPKTLRHRLLHTSARLIKGGRRIRIRIPATWPWAEQLANAINTVLAMPAPT